MLQGRLVGADGCRFIVQVLAGQPQREPGAGGGRVEGNGLLQCRPSLGHPAGVTQQQAAAELCIRQGRVCRRRSGEGDERGGGFTRTLRREAKLLPFGGLGPTPRRQQVQHGVERFVPQIEQCPAQQEGGFGEVRRTGDGLLQRRHRLIGFSGSNRGPGGEDQRGHVTGTSGQAFPDAGQRRMWGSGSQRNCGVQLQRRRIVGADAPQFGSGGGRRVQVSAIQVGEGGTEGLLEERLRKQVHLGLR